MYGYELDELLKQYGLSNPSNTYGGTPMPTGTKIDPLQQAAYDADQAKYQNYLNEYNNRLQNTNMYSASQFQSPSTHSDMFNKQVGTSVVPQVGTPAYENYVKNINSQLKPDSLGMLNQSDLEKLMDKYGENRYDIMNATGSWWGDVLNNPNYQNYKATGTPKVTTPVDVLPTKTVDVLPTKTVDVLPTKTVDVLPTTPVDVLPTKTVDVLPTGTDITLTTIDNGNIGNTKNNTNNNNISTISGGNTNDNLNNNNGITLTVVDSNGNPTELTGTTNNNNISTISGGSGNDVSTTPTENKDSGTTTNGITLTVVDSDGNPTGLTGTTNSSGSITLNPSTNETTNTPIDLSEKPTGTTGDVTLTNVNNNVGDKGGTTTPITGTTEKPNATGNEVTLTTIDNGTPETTVDTGGATTSISGIDPAAEAAAKAEEEARLKAEQEAANKAQQEAAAKAEEEARLKAEQEAANKAQQEAANKTTQDLANKYNLGPINSTDLDKLALPYNSNQQTVEQQGPYTPEKQKAIEEKYKQEAAAKAEEEARLKAQQEAATKAQQEATAKAEQEMFDRVSSTDTKISKPTGTTTTQSTPVIGNIVYNPSTGEYVDTSTMETVAPEKVAEQQEAAAKAQQEKADAEKAKIEKAVAEAKTPTEKAAAEAAQSARDARIATDTAAADAKALKIAEEKVKIAANKADKAQAVKEAADAKAAALKSAKEAKTATDKAAADAKALKIVEATEKAAAEQKRLNEVAEANPTIENIAAKYHIVPDAAKAAQLMATKGLNPVDAAAAMPQNKQNTLNKKDFSYLYTIMDEFKKNDLAPDKVPTVAELAKHYNIGENTVLSALLMNTSATEKEINDFMAKHPIDNLQQMKSLPDIANAIRVKLGQTVQNAASESAALANAAQTTVVDTSNTSGQTGQTGSSSQGGSDGKTSTIVPNSSGGLTSTTPIKQPENQPASVDATKQITKAADLANKIVEQTKDLANPVSKDQAKEIAVEFVTIPKEQLKDFKEQTLLDSIADFAKMIMPGPAYVIDALGNVVQGKSPMNVGDYVRNIYSKDTSVDFSSLVPDFLKNWASGEDSANTVNALNSGHILELSAPKDAAGFESNPVAVIKVPAVDQVSEKFSDFIINNKDNLPAIQKYAKENNLDDSALTKAVKYYNDNKESIKQFDIALDKALADGTLQSGKLIGSELFPTTNAGIDALIDGAVPLKLGVPLIAEIKSLINGTNYDDALAQEYNDFNHWAAANPIQAKVLQTLGVLGASQFTGGLGPYDSIKVSNIWNQDLGINARSIAVNLNDKGPITATPIDSKGNPIGQTITLNKENLPSNFLDTIGTHVEDAYNDIINSIAGTAGSISDFFFGDNSNQDEMQLPNDFTGEIIYPSVDTSTNSTTTGNEIYDNVIKGLSDLWSNEAFSSLGNLSPSADWISSSNGELSSPGYYDLGSSEYWGSSLGNFDNSNFGDWGSNGGIAPGWDQSGFGFNSGSGWDSSNIFEGGSNAGFGWDWGDIGSSFDNFSMPPPVTDLGYGAPLVRAKGGLVSKEINRLYKKYGGEM